MYKKIQIQIPTPCTQSWNEMQAVPGGKFCGSCEKKVIDFTLLNDRQILEIFRNNKHVCGRFIDGQLNRNLTITDKHSNSIIPSILISTVLVAGIPIPVSAQKSLPAIEKNSVRSNMDQDTSSPAEKKLVMKADSIVSVTDQCQEGGYSALSGGLEVVAKVPERHTNITGTASIITFTEIRVESSHKRHSKRKMRRFFGF